MKRIVGILCAVGVAFAFSACDMPDYNLDFSEITVTTGNDGSQNYADVSFQVWNAGSEAVRNLAVSVGIRDTTTGTHEQTADYYDGNFNPGDTWNVNLRFYLSTLTYLEGSAYISGLVWDVVDDSFPF
jgi:hypothetical protein